MFRPNPTKTNIGSWLVSTWKSLKWSIAVKGNLKYVIRNSPDIGSTFFNCHSIKSVLGSISDLNMLFLR